MKNKLQNVFSHTEPEEYLGQIRFTNSEFSKEFQNKLKKMYETGVPQAIDGLDRIELNQIIEGKKYPLDNHDRITQAYIYPVEEPVKIHVKTEYGDFTWDFNRIRSKEKIVLNNSKESIFFIKFEFLKAKKVNNVNFTFNSKPHCAKSIRDIIHAYLAVLALFAQIFQKESSQITDIISLIQSELKFWKRARNLEELLNINFDPNKIDLKIINETMQETDELYLLLVEKVFLRENRGFNSFTAGSLLKKK